MEENLPVSGHELERRLVLAMDLDSVLRLKIWKDTRGQELVDCALIGACLVTAAGAVSPAVAVALWSVFSRVTTSLSLSGGGSGQPQ